MNNSEYAEKLKQFNKTDKYRAERDFLFSLMSPQEGEAILDYGCGTGTLVNVLRTVYDAKAYGYDVNDFEREGDNNWYIKETALLFDKVFFMHSLAHVDDIYRKLETLRRDGLKEKGRVYVITPNKLWLDKQNKDGYIPDPTVIRHFSPDKLGDIFRDCGRS